MFKRVSLIVGILLLSILLLGYALRLPLLQWVIAPQLEKAGITLSCLVFSVTPKLDIYAEKACLNYQNQELVMTGITANTKHIVIERAELNVNPLTQSNASSSPAKVLDLALPEKRPTITVEQLTINSELLKQPLMVNVNEPRLNELEISGDLNASAKLYNDNVQGTITVNDELLKQVIKTENGRFNGLSFNISHAFSFNGLKVNTTGAIQAQYMHNIQSCDISNTTTGVLSTKFDLNSQHLELDASKLKNQLVLNHGCQSLVPESDYQTYAVKQLPLNWQWVIAEPVRVENNKLTLPLLTLKSVGQEIVFTFENSFIDTASPLQSARSQLKAQLHTADIDAITLDAELNNTELSGHYDIVLASLPASLPVAVTNLTGKGDFTVKQFIDSKPVGTVNSTFNIEQLKAYGTTVKAYTGKLAAAMTAKYDANVTLESAFKSMQYNEYELNEISNTLNAKANLAAGELFADFTANTEIAAVISPNIDLNNIKVASQALQSRALNASHHAFINGVELVVEHHMSKVEHPFEVIIPEQNVQALNSIISQFEPLAQLTQGEFGGRINGDVNLQSGQFTLNINNTSALYNDYLVNQLSTQLSGQFNSGQLNVVPTTFNLNELRAGAVVNNITGNIKVVNNNAQVFAVSGDIFGGAFSFDNYSLLKTPQTTHVTFENIDASQLIILDEQSGITLTGRLKGTLPLHFNENGAEITGGSLLNQGDGKLIISNNAAFDAVMQQQQELQPILGLLKNLDIQKLNSTVALKSDGWLNLGVNLQGYNQAEQQQVNFNYNHEENVFTLLRALRLSDEITQKVEQQYSQKGN